MGIKDKFKFDLSKTEDKLKLFILISGTLLFVLVATVGGISLTMSPEFCKLCHATMNPEYVTWKYSSHSQIRCVDCHMKPGLVNTVKDKIIASKHLYSYVLKDYKKPIKIKNEMSDELCLRCHSVQTRTFTLSGDLIVPHELHGEKGVSCVKCHSGVAHGNIAGRKVATDDLSAWTMEDGKKNMALEYVRPDMDVCVDCHLNPPKYGVKNIEKVNWSCEACHKQIFTPKSHRQKNFLTVHGIDAEKDLKGCVSCHNVGTNTNLAADGVKLNKMASGQKVKDFAWTNKFCVDCHAKLPDNHKDRNTWMPYHKEAVTAKGMKNCVACHNVKKEEPVKAPANLTCNKCHWFK